MIYIYLYLEKTCEFKIAYLRRTMKGSHCLCLEFKQNKHPRFQNENLMISKACNFSPYNRDIN